MAMSIFVHFPLTEQLRFSTDHLQFLTEQSAIEIDFHIFIAFHDICERIEFFRPFVFNFGEICSPMIADFSIISCKNYFSTIQADIVSK